MCRIMEKFEMISITDIQKIPINLEKEFDGENYMN